MWLKSHLQLKNKINNIFLGFVKKKKIPHGVRMPSNYLSANVLMTWKYCKGQLSNLVIDFFFFLSLLVIKLFSTELSSHFTNLVSSI